jgi:hypothetical protein
MKMKSIVNYTVITLLAIVLVSCIEEFGGTGESADRKEQVTGSWKVITMVQRDLLTDNPDVASFDITSVYSFTQYTLTLNADGSFTTSNPGNAPEFVISSGTWAFDDDQFPSAIILSGSGSTSVLDFGSLNSLTDRNELEVTFTRKVLIPDNDGIEHAEDAIGYEYTLSKI